MERGLLLGKGLRCGMVKHAQLGSGGILQLCEFAKIISMHASRGLILYYGNYTSISSWFGFYLFASCLLAFNASERMREWILRS